MDIQQRKLYMSVRTPVSLCEKVLQGAGTISHTKAIEKATEEYKKYQVQNLSPVEVEYLESIKDIHSTVKKKGNVVYQAANRQTVTLCKTEDGGE